MALLQVSATDPFEMDYGVKVTMVNSNFVSKTDCQPPIEQSVCVVYLGYDANVLSVYII